MSSYTVVFLVSKLQLCSFSFRENDIPLRTNMTLAGWSVMFSQPWVVPR
jgi:hypothetical protein